MISKDQAEGVRAEYRGVVHSLAVNQYDVGRYGKIMELIRQGKTDEEIREECPKWDGACLGVCRKIAEGRVSAGDSRILNDNPRDGMRFRKDKRAWKRILAQEMYQKGARVTEIMEATGLKRRSVHELVCGLEPGRRTK